MQTFFFVVHNFLFGRCVWISGVVAAGGAGDGDGGQNDGVDSPLLGVASLSYP